MKPLLARILPTALTGVLLFSAGFWWGGRSGSGTPPSRSKSGDESATTVRLPRTTTETDGGAVDLGLPQGGFPGILDQVLANPDRAQREKDLLALGGRDFAVGADWRTLSASIADLVDRAIYLKGYFQAWARQKPLEAADEALKRGLSERGKLLPEVVAIWANSNPTAAEAWLVKMRSSEAREQALESLYRTWATQDPGGAVNRALVLPDDSARFRALAAAIREWSVNDLAGVREWAGRVSDPNLKDFAMMAVADELSARSPKEAMQWASSHLAADPEANPDIVNLVASKAGFETPRDTFDWLLTLPESAETQSSLSGVAAYLTEDNPDFAFKEFAKLPEALQSVTAAPIASTLGAQDPEGGKRWLADLPAGETRRFATSAFAAGWATRDVAAAEAWVSNLPAGDEKTAAEEGLRNAFGGTSAEGTGGSVGQ